MMNTTQVNQFFYVLQLKVGKVSLTYHTDKWHANFTVPARHYGKEARSYMKGNSQSDWTAFSMNSKEKHRHPHYEIYAIDVEDKDENSCEKLKCEFHIPYQAPQHVSFTQTWIEHLVIQIAQHMDKIDMGVVGQRTLMEYGMPSHLAVRNERFLCFVAPLLVDAFDVKDAQEQLQKEIRENKTPVIITEAYSISKKSNSASAQYHLIQANNKIDKTIAFELLQNSLKEDVLK